MMHTFNFELSFFLQLISKNGNIYPLRLPNEKIIKISIGKLKLFYKKKLAAKEKYTNPTIRVGDWVNYTFALLNNDGNPALDAHAANLWVRIGDEEPDKPFQELFIRKKNGETFSSNNPIFPRLFYRCNEYQL